MLAGRGLSFLLMTEPSPCLPCCNGILHTRLTLVGNRPRLYKNCIGLKAREA